MQITPVTATRQQRRALEAENRKQPPELVRIPESEWPTYRPPRIKEVWRSRGFLVQVFAEASGVERLSVCRTSIRNGDWQEDIRWDELQRLKRECGRGDKDAVEIFPADCDVVNVANMRHLWLAGDLAFKWKARGEKSGTAAPKILEPQISQPDQSPTKPQNVLSEEYSDSR